MRYLTKHDLDTRLYGIERYIPHDPSTQDLCLATSSGTTTGLPAVYVTYHPIHERNSVYQEWFRPWHSTVRISRNNPVSLRTTLLTLATETSNRVMVLDEKDMMSEHLSQVMRDYEPETLLGQPSRVLLWAQRLVDAGAKKWCEHIHLIQMNGELLTPLHRTLIKKAFPNATVRNGYTFSGAALPTIDCPASNGERLHVLKGKTITRLRIANPDETGMGEIIATTNELENFRTGDLGRLDPTPCPCGKSPILVLCGRKDFDRVTILGATFLKEELECVLEPLSKDLADYQLRVGEVSREGTLIGRAEFDFVPREGSTVSGTELIERVMHNLFVTKTRTFADIIKAGIFAPPVARCVAHIAHGIKHISLKRVDFSRKEDS